MKMNVVLATVFALIMFWPISTPAEKNEEKNIQNDKFSSWMKALEVETEFYLPKLIISLKKAEQEINDNSLKEKINRDWLPILKKHGQAVKDQIAMIKDFIERPEVVPDDEILAGIVRCYPKELDREMNRVLEEINRAGLFPDFGKNVAAEQTCGIKELIEYHQKIHPALGIQDVYKLIYQGIFGPEHLLSADAKSYLEKEFAALTDESSTTEPLIENISTDGEVVRINLRQFKLKKLSLEKLWTVMLISEKELRSGNSAESFEKAWEEFGKLVLKKELNFDPAELEAFNKIITDARKLSNKGYPAVHHSEEYRQIYKPSYRVVKKSVFREYFPNVD